MINKYTCKNCLNLESPSCKYCLGDGTLDARPSLWAGSIKECINCFWHLRTNDVCHSCEENPNGPTNWKQGDNSIQGVAEEETVSNEAGGKQSKLEYRFDLIDAKALFAVAKVMHEGAQKYEKDNWRKIDVEDHLNHALSHIYAYLAGDKQDNHLEHAATRLLMGLGVRYDV